MNCAARVMSQGGLVLILAVVFMGSATAQAPPMDQLDPNAPTMNITVHDPWEGRGGTTLPGRRLCVGTMIQYVPSSTLGRLVPLSRYWDERERRLKLRVGTGEALLTAGSRLVIVNGVEQLLAVPPWALDGDVWIPMNFIIDVLGPLSGRTFVWDVEADALLAGGAKANVQSLRIQVSSRQTRVRLRCAEALTWRLEEHNDGSYALKVYGGMLGAGAGRRLKPEGLLRSVTTRQYPDYVILEFEPESIVSNVRVMTEDTGRTLVAVLDEAKGDLPELPIRGEKTMAEAREFKVKRRVRTIVLDPGHGGDDAGVSVQGLEPEKDITLALAAAVRNELQGAGYSVVLTREDDRNLSPDARSERANMAGGDLFVSLHCNGWPSSSARGVEAWYLSSMPLDAGYGENDFLPWELVQQLHLGRSAVFAERLLNEMENRTDLSGREVKQALLPVLQGVNMPAVVLEVGFLTNAHDAELLSGKDTRRDLARGIARSILAAVSGTKQAGGER